VTVTVTVTRPTRGAPLPRGSRQRLVLWTCLETGLRLLHPFMPFVTEELWQRLPKRPDTDAASVPSIMLADYPAPSTSRAAPRLESDFDFALGVVTLVRKMRGDYGLIKQRPQLFVSSSNPHRAAVLSTLAAEIATLSSSSAVEVLATGAAPPAGCGVAIVDDATNVYMLLTGVLDPALEIHKLQQKVAEVEARRATLRTKMARPTYDKTPENVKADDQERLSKADAELSVAHAAIADFHRFSI
jgi:valyl-tRNA synthetase